MSGGVILCEACEQRIRDTQKEGIGVKMQVANFHITIEGLIPHEPE